MLDGGAVRKEKVAKRISMAGVNSVVRIVYVNMPVREDSTEHIMLVAIGGGDNNTLEISQAIVTHSILVHVNSVVGGDTMALIRSMGEHLIS